MLRKSPRGGVAKPSTDSGDDGSSDGDEPAELGAANKACSNAERAVAVAVAAAGRAAHTPSARDEAARLIAQARSELSRAVELAQDAVNAAEGPAALGAAARALSRATGYRSAQEAVLDDARGPFAWHGRNLVRYQFANGEAVMPREGANVATIMRIPRTIPSPADADTQIANPDAFTSATFKNVMYAEGKKVFSVTDDDDEFKVDGYVKFRSSSSNLDRRIYTGLKLTDAGLVVRTGGTADLVVLPPFYADFTDMRKKITTWASDSDSDGDVDADDGIRGQNGWDLAITFDEPQTTPVPVDFDDISNAVSSWTGNGAFYWKSLVPADPSQLDEDGDYYDANAFNQPEGYRDLGTYEVWLSNHIGVDKKLEPVPGQGAAVCPDGSRGTSCPNDDEHRHLKYAAYGLFVYTASTETFRVRLNGHFGRVNTLHFGYSAFGSGEGRKTADIGEAITGGKFHGYALAYEVSGDNDLEGGDNRTGIETRLLRGDVTLTVSIPKGTGAGTLEGTMSNFQQWHRENKYWTAYLDDFTVALNSAAIGESGAFSGTTQATPSRIDDIAFRLNAGGAGVYKGSFYGSRADAEELEVAGSWTIGSGGNFDGRKDIYGSFGAKQKPPETPASD